MKTCSDWVNGEGIGLGHTITGTMEATKKKYKSPTSFSALLSEPKGKTSYATGEAFMLHVVWETPSAEAASELLRSLACCAAATHRDTPAVPTYFFRLSVCDSDDLCPPAPTTVGEFPALVDATRKLARGVPRQAVHAELAKKGIDHSLMSLPVDAPLPAELLGRKARIVELTEVYLDERAFVEHGGSRDFLDGHALVMNPALLGSRRPCTLQFGTPNAGIVERILEPVLQAAATPLEGDCRVWRPSAVVVTVPDIESGDTSASNSSSAQQAVFLSLDAGFGIRPADATAALPTAFREACSTLAVFDHPMRVGTSRLLAVLPYPPTATVLADVDQSLHVVRGQIHSLGLTQDTLAALVEAAGLDGRVIVNSEFAGYVLHAQASELVCS